MLLNYLKPMAIFAAVVETGSFTQAGKRLDMPRGKVSEQIKRLEVYLRVKLFHRSTRKVTVTAEGTALYQHAKQLLRNGLSGIEEVKSFAEEMKGTIRITTTNDFYECLLLPILKSFHTKYPGVTFDLLITEESLAVIDDSIDLAIRSGVMPDSSLISLPLTTTRLKIYASPQLEQPLPQHPEQLSHLDWICLRRMNQMESVTLYGPQNQQFDFIPNYRHQANTISSYNQLIEQNFGIGLMAELTADVLVRQGRLITILDEWSQQPMPISLLYPARLHMAHRTRLLIEEIRQAFAE